MKPGRKRWIEILLAVALLVTAVIFFSSGGPYYQGRSAGYWFNHTNSTSSLIRSTGWAPVPIEAERAFRAMGKDAVPYLVNQLAPDSAWTSYYMNHYAAWPVWVRRIFPPPRPPGARQQRAAYLLGVIGPPAESAVPALIASYNRNWLQRYNQPRGTPLDWPTLLTNPPAWLSAGKKIITSGWLLGLSVDDSPVRALTLIGGTNRQIIPLLLLSARELGANGEIYTRPGKFPALAPAIRDAEPLLISSLSHQDAAVRTAATLFLSVLAPEHPAVVPPLINALKDPALAVRFAAMSSLADATNQLDRVVPALCATLADSNSRDNALRVLPGIDNYSPRMISLLEKSLDHDDARVRSGVLEVLSKIGPLAKAAVPRIEPLAYSTNEWDREVAYQASLALWNINREPKALVPFRIKDLLSDNDTVRWNAAAFLGQIGPAAKPALPALVQTLKSDTSPRVRAKAAIALGQLGTDAAETIPDLREATKDEYANVQKAAAEALDQIRAADSHK